MTHTRRTTGRGARPPKADDLPREAFIISDTPLKGKQNLAAPFISSEIAPGGRIGGMSVEEIRANPVTRRALCTPGIDSTTRLGPMLDELKGRRGADFWLPFATVWPTCDDTWPHRHRLTMALGQAGPGWQDAIGPEDFEWFDELPDQLTVYRGCTVERLFGLSWTVDRQTAIQFAYGHRGIRPPEAVLAKVRINKADILFACDRREEGEVLVEVQWAKGTCLEVRPLWTIKEVWS